MRPAPGDVRTVVCAGTGVIGGGWVAWFLARGYDVVAWDPAPGADERLHQQPRNRPRDPQDRQLVDRRAQCLEDAADICVLQGKTKLDPQEAKAHVPDLPEI